MKFNHFKAVVFRELKQMLQRPIYIYMTILAPLFCCIFLITLMDEGMPQKEPIGIIDHDNSSLSRRFVREISATQYVDVVQEYSSYQEAREAMQNGIIYAFLEIPKDYYSDVLGYRQPSISFYINNAYLVGGSLSYKDLKMMANLSGGAVQMEVLR
ncbi:MAG: ABC transporter permease, partial [Bacteroidales bacterium]|nr:ABC transporter permease [Bacteroidales bacterium]